MHSPALLSAVLLFTASSFSHALVKRLPVDGAVYDDPATVAARADSAATEVQGCLKSYTPKRGDTCTGIADQSKQQNQPPFKPFDVDWFINTNPSVNKQCTSMIAGQPYCVDGLDAAGRKKLGSNPKHHKSDTPKQTNGDGHDVGNDRGHGKLSSFECTQWHTVHPGDNCLSVSQTYKISWSDIRQWNPTKAYTNGNGDELCSDLHAGEQVCVKATFTYRAIGYYHAGCNPLPAVPGKKSINSDISVPPGSQHEDGVCVNTHCNIGSLQIPDIGDCPSGQVQIAYYEYENCPQDGQFYGYGYASRGQCHTLWKEGWMSKSIWLRCAPKENDCSTTGQCAIDGEPKVGICARSSITSFNS